MNINQMMNLTGTKAEIALILFILIPVLTFLLNIVASPDNEKAPWKYIYSGIVYMVCVPGIFGGIVTLYTLLFLKQNLLNLNIATYYLPIISMIVTLAVIRKKMIFKEIPGFKKLSGLMLVIAVTFISVIILERTRIFVITSMQGFIILSIILFFILRYGIKLVFGDFKKENKNETEK